MRPGANDCDEQDILQELERVSAGDALANAPQLRAMLRYLVTEALAGRSDAIKAYNIAVDVFGRATSFDPATDTIVRVQAGRLRAALAKHYGGAEPGQVRIELPKGSYAPAFVRLDGEAPPGAAGVVTEPAVSGQAVSGAAGLLHGVTAWISRRLKAVDWQSPVGSGAVLAGLVAIMLLLTAAMSPRRPDATTAVLTTPVQVPADTVVLAPLHSLSGLTADQNFAKALTAELATALARTGVMKMRLLGSDLDAAGAELRDGARSHAVRWALTGVLHGAEALRRANIYLVDLTTSEVIWSQDYTRTSADPPNGLADAIILDLRPQLYSAAKHALEDKPALSAHELFMLATWFPGAEVNSLSWQLDRISLARRAISADPNAGRAYSVLADKLTLLATLDPAFDTEATWREAAEAAREARVLAPHSADVAFNLALYHLHAGELDEAHRAVQRTLELAPRHTLARFWTWVIPYTCTAPPQDVLSRLRSFDAALSPSNPARWQTQAWLARLLLNSGSYREASEAARRSMQMVPNLGAAIIYTAAQVELGEAGPAREAFGAQQRYWKTFSFQHYNDKALTRLCRDSPQLERLVSLHRAAAAAMN